MSLLKANSVQIGQSATATQNFTLSVPSSPDGTIKLARGNSGATTQDIITVSSSGEVTFPSSTSFIVGMLLQYAGSTAPSKWQLCDGSAISRTTYSDLFSVIGTTYGSGNGTTTFNIPDLRGRTSIGAGTGSGLTARTLGASGGAETVTLTDEIGTFGSHSHTYPTYDNLASARTNVTTASSRSSANLTTSSSTVSGSGASHANMQPFLSVNFIIYSGV